MKASAANFLTVIKGPKQFVIPIYQRTYSWQITFYIPDSSILFGQDLYAKFIPLSGFHYVRCID